MTWLCAVCLDELAVTQVDGTYVGRKCAGKMLGLWAGAYEQVTGVPANLFGPEPEGTGAPLAAM
jgi:hypothetical protein